MSDISLEINDIEMLTELENGRFRFYDKLNRSNVINKMKELIDNVDGVDFITPRARKFISESRPRFILLMSDDFINRFNNDRKMITDFTHKEVIRKYLEWVSDFIDSSVDVSDLLDNLRKKYGVDKVKSHIVDVLSNILVDMEKKELIITLLI